MSLITKQLALDLQVPASRLQNTGNLFVTRPPVPTARSWARDVGDIVIRKGRLWVRTTKPEVTAALADAFGQADGAWFLEMKTVEQLTELLRNFGLKVTNMAPFFVPSNQLSRQLTAGMHLIEADAIPKYQANHAIKMAFGYDPAAPDRLGIGYELDGDLVAVAGASQNGRYCWEIGVELLDLAFRHQGIASRLVQQLTAEIQHRRQDVLPLYGTQFSHVQSMNVAIRAGFVLGWTELLIGKAV
ncbi:GNAT family N-acetyltransferase [Lacticaseibacillus paracasei]|uniref:GNAT family N-acetyltransferase n=1 Tax=Lacticaseibacillus paracasei TaxID=1597 RepID=UPI002358BB52|nr:GNAT family N-acetyltransferase [Lacticaseibacillus paracasei]WCZ20484.1 GNAT family N-acetyltransferase [Lacticaseibacillus paracasei]